MNDALWQPAYVAFGSNLDDPQAQIRRAIDAVRDIPATHSWVCSSLYCSTPMGPQDQPAYINAVAGLLSQLEPTALLSALHDIEQVMGRQRTRYWGPRIIDLDLLMLGQRMVTSSALTLPHPGLMERNFVMVPLAEIAPSLLLPNGQLAMQCAAQLGMQGLERLS